MDDLVRYIAENSTDQIAIEIAHNRNNPVYQNWATGRALKELGHEFEAAVVYISAVQSPEIVNRIKTTLTTHLKTPNIGAEVRVRSAFLLCGFNSNGTKKDYVEEIRSALETPALKEKAGKYLEILDRESLLT